MTEQFFGVGGERRMCSSVTAWILGFHHTYGLRVNAFWGRSASPPSLSWRVLTNPWKNSLHSFRPLWIKLMFRTRAGSSKSSTPTHYQLMHFEVAIHTHTHTQTCGRWLAGPALSLFVLIKLGMKLRGSLYRSTERSINKISPLLFSIWHTSSSSSFFIFF